MKILKMIEELPKIIILLFAAMLLIYSPVLQIILRHTCQFVPAIGQTRNFGGKFGCFDEKKIGFVLLYNIFSYNFVYFIEGDRAISQYNCHVLVTIKSSASYFAVL